MRRGLTVSRIYVHKPICRCAILHAAYNTYNRNNCNTHFFSQAQKLKFTTKIQQPFIHKIIITKTGNIKNPLRSPPTNASKTTEISPNYVFKT